MFNQYWSLPSTHNTGRGKGARGNFSQRCGTENAYQSHIPNVQKLKYKFGKITLNHLLKVTPII